MKWLFLINDAQFLPEFMGKISKQATMENDSCVIVFNGKIAEYGKIGFFPKNVKIISKVDWCQKNYKEKDIDFDGLSWKEIFPVYERLSGFSLSYKKAIKISSQLFEFFEYIFDEEKPDVIVGEAPADIFHETAYHFCQNNNVKYLSLEESKFDKKIDIYDFRHINTKYERDFLKINGEDMSSREKDFADKFIKDFVSHKLLPGYTNFYGVKFSQLGVFTHYLKRLKQSGAILFKYFLNRRKVRDFDYESEAIFKNGIKAPLETEKRQAKIFLQKNVFEKMSQNDDKFFFSPLHFQPESSTSVYATYYYDQLNTVKNTAFCLPLPYKLYVKEHPASIGLRTNDFYKKLKDIPNVVLLSPSEDVQNIIMKSAGVIVLTGTIGMESALLGKPTYVLGTTLYYHHPFCRKIKGFPDLKETLEKDLSQKIEVKNLEEINRRFIISYFRNTINGSIISASIGKDINDYNLICKKLKEFL